MNTRTMSVVVISFAVFLLLVGAAGALPQRLPAGSAAIQATVSGGITYQGRLTDPEGKPLNGTFTMSFTVYDAAVGGTSLWGSGNLSVNVDDGLFTVRLGVNPAIANGQALWLRITVAGQALSPRQEILPAPYALGLRPGASIVGDGLGDSGAALSGYAPATGTALFADANGGVGLFGSSVGNYGVRGSSIDSWGGYFTSDGGHGIRVETGGTAHYDHGAYVTSEGGYGVYAKSALNQAVRGEAGNVTGISQPLGAVGVVGIGSNRGTYGSSRTGIGLYGVSTSYYGVWGQSTEGRGVTGRTSRSDNNYGFYTPDNIYALNYILPGSMLQVMQNGGSEFLAAGDVVVFSGLSREVAGVDSPIVQVSRADVANSTAVAGVVYSRFNLDAIDPDLDRHDAATEQRLVEMSVTPAGDAAPGEYVLVVVHGSALVKASAVGASIQPGDLLSTASGAGLAGRAATVSMSGVETTVPGTVIGKALEPLNGAQDLIYVYVTLK